MTDLEVPNLFNPAHGRDLNFSPSMPDVIEAANQYKKRHNIQNGFEDRTRVELLLIDCQKDFCFPVSPGQSEDQGTNVSIRIAEFIYRNLPYISYITTMMRIHWPYQIFSPIWWVDERGNNIEPATVISSEDIRLGKFQPSPEVSQFTGTNYTWALKQSEFYVKAIEDMGHQLRIHPFHCLMGSHGSNMTGIVQEACWFHSIARGVQPNLQIYDTNPWTECRSVFGADYLLRWDGKGALDQKDAALAHRLLNNDHLLIAGYSGYHSITSTLDDLMHEISFSDPGLTRKIHILTDCILSSSETGADVKEAFEDYNTAGMKLVKSTEPI